jgi:hypothetical protein
VDAIEIRHEGVNCIHLPQDSDQWLVLIKTVMTSGLIKR